MKRLIECVPNFSEGRDPSKVDAIVGAMSSVPGVYVLDREMDADHHRCVITLAGEPDAAAATRPDRVNLENVRRGQFEGLREELKKTHERQPDVGEPKVHPTAGVTVVGARKFLIAYNVNLNTSDIGIANKIAKAIRFSSGGLRYVKSM